MSEVENDHGMIEELLAGLLKTLDVSGNQRVTHRAFTKVRHICSILTVTCERTYIPVQRPQHSSGQLSNGRPCFSECALQSINEHQSLYDEPRHAPQRYFFLLFLSSESLTTHIIVRDCVRYGVRILGCRCSRREV